MLVPCKAGHSHRSLTWQVTQLSKVTNGHSSGKARFRKVSYKKVLFIGKRSFLGGGGGNKRLLSEDHLEFRITCSVQQISFTTPTMSKHEHHCPCFLCNALMS